MKRLLKTLHCENGKLYSIVDGRRILPAGCNVSLQAVEEQTSAPVFKTGAAVRRYRNGKSIDGLVKLIEPLYTERYVRCCERGISHPSYPIGSEYKQKNNLITSFYFGNGLI